MIRFFALAAIFSICSAAEKTKAPVTEVKPKVEDTNSEPSGIQDEYLGLEPSQLWDTQKSRGENLDLTEEENRIVQDVYSPDYYEPNVILDFRYLKTGGRGYARSDGGQILILPRRNHMPVTSNNYDTLLEFLRLKHLESMERKWGTILRRENEEHRYGPDTYYDDLH